MSPLRVIRILTATSGAANERPRSIQLSWITDLPGFAISNCCKCWVTNVPGLYPCQAKQTKTASRHVKPFMPTALLRFALA